MSATEYLRFPRDWDAALGRLEAGDDPICRVSGSCAATNVLDADGSLWAERRLSEHVRVSAYLFGGGKTDAHE